LLNFQIVPPVCKEHVAELRQKLRDERKKLCQLLRQRSGSKSTAASRAVQKKKEFSLCRARILSVSLVFRRGAHETHIKTEPEGAARAGDPRVGDTLHRGTFLTHSIPKSSSEFSPSRRLFKFTCVHAPLWHLQ
jgi:hypothetical protein